MVSNHGRQQIPIRRKVISFTLALVFSVLLAAEPVGVGQVAQAANNEPLFEQGAGYEQGAYDRHAVQPTSFNWTRQSRFDGPEQPETKWAFDSGGPIDSSPAIGADDTIYFGNMAGEFLAVNSDGSLKWKYAFGKDIDIYASPAIGADGTIYVGAMTAWGLENPRFCNSGSCGWGGLAAFSPEGKLKWAVPLPEVVTSTSPVIGSDGTIYIGSGSYYEYGKLYAFDPSGQLLWSGELANEESGFAAAPAIFADGTIFAQDAFLNQDGVKQGVMTYLWTQFSSPVIDASGTAYFGIDGNMVAAFQTGAGYVRPTWGITFSDGSGNRGRIASSPALGSNGVLYIGHENGSLYAINKADVWATSPNSFTDAYSNPVFNYYNINNVPRSDLNWTYATSAWTNSPIIGNNGTIYIGNDDGKLTALHPNGTEQWSVETGTLISNQVIGRNHTLYVTSDRQLLAIGEKSASLPEPQVTEPSKPFEPSVPTNPTTPGTPAAPVTPAKPAASTTSGYKQVNVVIDGKLQTFSQPAIVKKGSTLVPLRGVFEALKADVSWNAKTGTVTATKGSIKIVLTVGKSVAYVNGKAVTLTAKAEIINGSTMVPLRFVSESLKANVSWDSNTFTATITSTP